MPQMTVDQAFQTAVELHRGGRLAEAEAVYRQVVAAQPAHADALHLLGMLVAATGRADAAVALFDRAIAVGPQAEFFYSRGSSLLQLGRTDAAVADFRQATGLRSDFAEGFFALGSALRAGGRHADAAGAFTTAARLRPGWADALNGLGVCLKSLGQLERAAAQYGLALAAVPNHFESLLNLGNLRREQRDSIGAVDAYTAAVAVNPKSAAAHNALGLALVEAGRWTAAVAAHRAAIAADPGFSEAYANLSAALMLAARHTRDSAAKERDQAEALRSAEHAVRAKPDFGLAYVNWGGALTETGQPAAAVPVLEQAVRLLPDSGDAWAALGLAHTDSGGMNPAIEAYRRSLALRPDHPETSNNYAIALLAVGEAGEAETAVRRAIAAGLKGAGGYNTLANVLKDQGRLDETIAARRKVVSEAPDDPEIHSNLVFDFHYHPSYSASQLREQAELWAASHGRAESSERPPRGPRPERLRIGYVSADFTKHSVGRFILPVIQRHDRRRFEVCCFSNVPREDDLTPTFRSHSDRWHDVRALGDDALADLIRRERIDVLVDLSLHTAGNRLAVFARRPAPVQVTYIGYGGTTGVKQIDYVLADRYLAGDDPSAFTERIALLPNTYWCYRPPADAPAVPPPPSLTTGHVTFGCLNNFAKVTEPVIDLWAAILTETAGSRLLLHAKRGEHRRRMTDRFAGRGIDPSRISFVDPAPLAAFLALYSGIDIALDPFPFNGGTTTCDALWMGVPVVTFPGETPVGRAGASILHSASLAELVAADPAGYRRLAVDLARDPGRLVELRRTMRDRLRNSALTDEPEFVRDLEAVYDTVYDTI